MTASPESLRAAAQELDRAVNDHRSVHDTDGRLRAAHVALRAALQRDSAAPPDADSERESAYSHGYGDGLAAGRAAPEGLREVVYDPDGWYPRTEAATPSEPEPPALDRLDLREALEQAWRSAVNDGLHVEVATEDWRALTEAVEAALQASPAPEGLRAALHEARVGCDEGGLTLCEPDDHAADAERLARVLGAATPSEPEPRGGERR